MPQPIWTPVSCFIYFPLQPIFCEGITTINIRIPIMFACCLCVAGCVEVQRHFPVVRDVSLPVATSKSYASVPHTDRVEETFERSSGPAPGKTRTRRVNRRSPRKSSVRASTGEVRGEQRDEPHTQAASEPGWWSSDLTIGGWKIRADTVVVILAIVGLLVMITLSVYKALIGTVVFFSSYLDLFLSLLPLIIMFLVSRVGEHETSESASSIKGSVPGY